MGAEIPRYRREALDTLSHVREPWLLRWGDDIPLVLNNLAEAVEHAIVVIDTRDRGSGLELTVGWYR